MLFPERSNLIVCREGSISAWVRHALAIVHHGCTTALEAVVTQKPLFTYVPLELPLNRKLVEVPNRLGIRCNTVRHLIEAVSPLASGIHANELPAIPYDIKALLSLDQTGFAADRMLAVIAKLPSTHLPAVGSWLRVRSYLAVRELSRQLRSRPNSRHRYSTKREPFLQDTLRQRLATICRASGMPEARCDVLASDVVLIRPPQ